MGGEAYDLFMGVSADAVFERSVLYLKYGEQRPDLQLTAWISSVEDVLGVLVESHCGWQMIEVRRQTAALQKRVIT